MRHLYPFLFRFCLHFGGEKKRFAGLRMLRFAKSSPSAPLSGAYESRVPPPMSQRGFLPGHFCTMLWNSSAKMPTPKRKPEEAQLSVGFFLEG